MKSAALVTGYLVALAAVWFLTTTVPALILGWIGVTLAWCVVLIFTDTADDPHPELSRLDRLDRPRG